MLIIGITQEQSTQEYYLVSHHEIRPVLDNIIDCYDNYNYCRYMQYSDFHEFKEIGSGGYRTVYTAKYEKYLESDIPETVVINRFKNFDRTQKLFIFEVTFLILIYQLM